jgi:methylmalonyl-CoA decarboxylase subunit alpha
LSSGINDCRLGNLTMSEELNRRKARSMEMGGEKKLAARRASGKLNARERIDSLVDDGSFMEVGMLNHSDVPGMEDKTPADGKVCGHGRIDGRPAVVAADDFTVLAGTGGRVGGRKYRKLWRQALEQGCPIVNIGEGGGARIPDIMGSDGLSAMTIGKEAGSRCRQVPMVATIMGECYGAPSWYAALSDFVVQQKGSCMAVSGPRVLEIATGEKATQDELGGWELHAETTGQIDLAADTEEACLDLAKQFLSYLPSHSGILPPRLDSLPEDPARQDALANILPDDQRRSYDMHRVIDVIVDEGSVFELKPGFDPSVITALARLDGESVGIIASNPAHTAGAMGPDGCDKCCSFLCLCDSYNIPLIFLHDTPGFFVGKAAEQKRMPGKIINFTEALILSTVPKISLVIRRSYGMAFGCMCGGDMGADFEFAWPSADIGFTAPEVAANIVHARAIGEAADPEAARADAIAKMRSASAPWRAAGLGYLDDVIDPIKTRETLIRSLALARGSRPEGGLSDRRLASWPTTF